MPKNSKTLFSRPPLPLGLESKECEALLSLVAERPATGMTGFLACRLPERSRHSESAKRIFGAGAKVVSATFVTAVGERGEWPRLKLRMAGPGVDRHGHRKFEARPEGKTGVGFSPSKGRVAFCGAVRTTHNVRPRREQRQGNRTLSVPARRVAGRPKSVATIGAGLFGLEATRGCA
jgi:hypothetical protein